jgi:OHCU decarboxylase
MTPVEAVDKASRKVPLTALNAMDEPGFVATLGAIFEHAPAIAVSAYARRPFASVDALHGAMMAALRAGSRDGVLALLRAHPELAGQEAQQGKLTTHSTSEQTRLGFTALDRSELDRMRALNRAYREKFGFPCIIALALHQSRDTVRAEHERRFGNDVETEIENCLGQVAVITRRRLATVVDES